MRLIFSIDSSQKEILPQQFYQFQVTEGFAPVVQASRSSLSGKAILSMLDYEQGQDFSHEQLQLLGKLYRQMITSLLGDRPPKKSTIVDSKYSNSIVIRIFYGCIAWCKHRPCCYFKTGARYCLPRPCQKLLLFVNKRVQRGLLCICVKIADIFKMMTCAVCVHY